MTNATNETKRARKTGRYTFSKLDKLCTCGATLGSHEAEAPHQLDDACAPGFVKFCPGFKPAKKGA